MFGDLAASLYRAQTRLTDETALLVDAPTLVSARLVDALGTAGWRLLHSSPDETLRRFLHQELGYADLIAIRSQLERSAFQRSVIEVLRCGLAVRVPRREDAILFKLLAGKSNDLADIESILDAMPVLDEAYIERWAAEWDVLERWNTVRAPVK
ncbi:MAG TPA: hypothetical protein VFT98_22930 [Myxococcota bacterium]|nr:hypothetical protein [Myxococcota bacterium]